MNKDKWKNVRYLGLTMGYPQYTKKYKYFFFECIGTVKTHLKGGNMTKGIGGKGSLPSFKTLIKNYFLALSIMVMLFGVLLLPSSHIMVHDNSLFSRSRNGSAGDTSTEQAFAPFVTFCSDSPTSLPLRSLRPSLASRSKGLRGRRLLFTFSYISFYRKAKHK